VTVFFLSSRRRHTRSKRDWSSDVCSSDLCFAQRYPEAIREEMPEVDAIMGVNEYQKLCQAIEEAGAGARPVYTDDDGTFFEYGRSEERRVGKECRSRRGRDA